MNWVRDSNERLVNIENWDFLDYQTISDEKTGLSVAFKIYLERNGEEQLLGYVNCQHGDGDEILERISKGVFVDLSTLEIVLYYYLGKEFYEENGDMPADHKAWGVAYDERNEEIKKLISKRFVED